MHYHSIELNELFNSSLSTELLMIKAHLLLKCIAVHYLYCYILSFEAFTAVLDQIIKSSGF
jgi:hypothetical protein